MKVVVDEVKRLDALRRYEILDTPPDGAFDRITALASKMFNMPIAIISLVDNDRIWFKSKFGIDGVEQIDREPGLCASAILSNEVYLVENAIEDPRCLTNPLVCGEFGLRFYAAAPLTTKEGYNLGTFCVIDKKQRYLSREQMQMLEDLASIVVDEIEIRLAARKTLAKSYQRITQLELENKELRGQ
ncbi:GAF domain-containing protein [Rufibacter roseus]|uniref:GAF domain-containing protein n=2 Tax=Rufibacter roseus TaxID=1567108 RepID=A0ABW2DQF4_9BACT|nr:GAF domain-containing protein [Rufibacter roseus]